MQGSRLWREFTVENEMEGGHHKIVALLPMLDYQSAIERRTRLACVVGGPQAGRAS